ncbi:MAG TPA: C45 family peptidase [Gemmataceae bacterium]|nr:C45 family peptidase [Gemmataceae bacterium]
MRRLAVCLGLVLFALPAAAGDKRYPEAKSGGGELKYVNGIPVAVLAGSPEEIGKQFGELVLKPAKGPLVGRVDSYMAKVGWGDQFPGMVKFAGRLFTMFPEPNQKEMLTAAKTADVDVRLLSALNLIPDLAKLGGCSTLIVEPARSSTAGPLFGRNLDWPPHENLPEFTLVVVYKPTGKHAVAAVTFPVILGVLSGMNDAGLCLTINEITASKDGSKKQDPFGVPVMYLYRKILEECTTLDEAEKMLKAHKRTTYFCLTACDAKGGCVFEVTPDNVVRRSGENAVCCCTNHFRTDELSVTKKCSRYPKLEAVQKADGKLGVGEVYKALDTVKQGPATVQAMVFEPATRSLHLSYGSDSKSATEKPLSKVELSDIFRRK